METSPLEAYWYIAQEAWNLGRTDLGKYKNKIVGLAMSGLLHWKETDVWDPDIPLLMQTGYYLVRGVDNIADGNREVTGAVDGFLRNLRDHFLNWDGQTRTPFQIFPSDLNRLKGLYEIALPRLENRVQFSQDNPRMSFVASVDAALGDHYLIQRREIPNVQSLTGKYLRSFLPALDLMFIGIRSSYRYYQDQPDNLLRLLALTQGSIQAVRDAESELFKGEINIPLEVLDHAGVLDFVIPGVVGYVDHILTRPFVREWQHNQLLKSHSDLQKIEGILDYGPYEPFTKALLMRGVVSRMKYEVESRLAHSQYIQGSSLDLLI